jgi:hypothetical protein
MPSVQDTENFVKEQITLAGGSISHSALIEALEVNRMSQGVNHLLPLATSGKIVAHVKAQQDGTVAVLSYKLPE